jgi:hypothetical protein
MNVIHSRSIFKVLIKRNKGSRVYALSRSLKRFGKSLGRLNRKSIARQAVCDARIRSHLLNYLGKHVMKEIRQLSSITVLRKRDLGSIQEFTIQSVVQEMEQCAPSLLAILRNCLAQRRAQTPKSKTRIFDVDHVVAVCCAVLLRGRSQRMNLFQRLISIILYSGHASKKVNG